MKIAGQTAKLCVSLSAFLVIVMLCSTCSAEPDHWTGTWRLDDSKSDKPGPSFVIRVAPDGLFEKTTAESTVRFRCDGKEYQTGPQTVSVCVQPSANRMNTESRKNGKLVSSAKQELSPDGKSLTSIVALFLPDGSKRSKELNFARMDASSGFAGAWRNKDTFDSADQIMEIKRSSSTLRIAFPNGHQYSDMSLDGTDAPLHEPTMSSRVTTSVCPNGPKQLLTTRKVDGKIVNRGTLTLSADGQFLIEEWWRPQKPETKGRKVYKRQ